MLNDAGNVNVWKSCSGPLPSMMPSVTKVVLTVPPPTSVPVKLLVAGKLNTVLYSAKSIAETLKGLEFTDVIERGA